MDRTDGQWRQLRAKRNYLALLVATILVCVVGVYAIQRSRPKLLAVRPSAAWRSINRVIMRKAGPTSAQLPDHVRIEGVGPDEVGFPMKVNDYGFRRVDRIWCPMLFSENLDGYTFFISLDREPGENLTLLGMQGPEPLSKVDAEEPQWVNLSSSRRRLEALAQAREGNPITFGHRTFTSKGGRHSWIVVTPLPIFQRDTYLQDGTVTTFAVFRDQVKAEGATVRVENP